MKTKNNKEVRLANISDFNIDFRDEGGENKRMIIEGYAAVFDSETLIGSEEWGFIEVIDRNAFTGANMKDVPLKYNHSDAVPILARTRNNSLVLSVDDKGLKIRAELLDTQDGNDMYKRIKSGLIDKMSFAFKVAKQEIDYKSKPMKRKITKFDRIFDVSVVDTPAYEETSIYARSLELSEDWRGALDSVQSKKRDYRTEILIKQFGGKR